MPAKEGPVGAETEVVSKQAAVAQQPETPQAAEEEEAKGTATVGTQDPGEEVAGSPVAAEAAGIGAVGDTITEATLLVPPPWAKAAELKPSLSFPLLRESGPDEPDKAGFLSLPPASPSW
uniref:Uncharacterized protein n=1 Tax=Arundo donax TaxID=35708 RepID=A0A0A9HSQ7_ARUDO